MKKKFMKSLLACTLSVALIGSMTACGNKPVANESSTKESTETQVAETSESTEAVEPQTLRVMWWGNQTRADATNEMLALFEETHPGVTVEVEFADWGGYWDKLSTQAISNNLPDVIQMDTGGYLVQYAGNGLLADLTSYMETGALDVSGVPASILESGKIGDSIYAMPTGSNANSYVYRTDVVEQAGVTIPEKMTWSELVEIAKIVYEKTGWKSQVLSRASSILVESMLRNDGLNFFNEDGTALGFDDPTYLVEAWERALTAQNEGYGLKLEEVTSEETSCFAKDTWDGIVWSNQVATYETDSACSLSLAGLPWRDGGTAPSDYLKPTMFWAVTETTDVKDLAVEFINFFVNETAVYDIVGIDRGIPVDAEIKEYISGKLEGTNKKVNEYIAYLSEEGNTGSIIVDVSPAAAEVRDKLVEYSEKVFYKVETDLEKAARDYMAEANKILAENAPEK